MCEACGVSLELATESPQAEQEREYIRTLIARGLTKQQILDELVDQYGPEILATPGDDGFDLAAWIVPALALLLAAVAIAVGLRRWRRAGAEAASRRAGAAGQRRRTRSASTRIWPATSSERRRALRRGGRGTRRRRRAPRRGWSR